MENSVGWGILKHHQGESELVMMNEEIQRLLEATNYQALLTLFDGLSVEDKVQVIGQILRGLEEQFYDDLPELVVKLCVEEPKKVSHAARHGFLSYWLKRQGYYHRPAVIESVVRRLRNERGEQLEAAIRTAWVIGYRDAKLVEQLEYIAGLQNQARTDENAEGWALAVLASMAYPNMDTISAKLHSRFSMNGRLTESDCWTAIHTATPDMISSLVEVAPSELLAVSALLEIPKRFPDAAQSVFDAFKLLDEKDQFFYGHSLTSKIDLPEVGFYVLSKVLATFEQFEKRNVLPSVNQLLHANKQQQLSSFVKAKETLSLNEVELLRSPAIKATGNEEDFHTSESITKEAVWNVILRLGLREARQWLPEAMQNEQNFTLLELAKFASFLNVEDAVFPLSRIVRDEKADYVIALGCLSSLGVIGTTAALEALLESRVHRQEGGNDDITFDLIEAIASACMTQNSCEAVWKRFSDAKSSTYVRRVCAYVIEDLSGYMNAPLPNLNELINLLRREGPSLPGYTSLLLSLPRYQDPIALDFLRELGASNHQSNELTQALAVSALLSEFPDRIEEIGFKKNGNEWTITKSLNDVAALALLCLYRSDATFESAVIRVLQDDSLYLATQIIANLKNSDKLSLPVRQTLFERAVHLNGRYFADRLSLEAVARTWPKPLLEEPFIETVSIWNSSARQAYISSLRVAFEEGSSKNIIAQLACRFLVDDESEVRRDAARLALASDPNVLRKEVHALAEKQDSLDHAIFLLDAAFWLDSEWQQVALFGASHRELLVREHCKTLEREREELLLSRTYLPLVLRSKDYLETWCYGQALLEIGNEETIDHIYAGLPSQVYRRSYLMWLAKEIKQRLEKKRKDQTSKEYLPPPAARQQRLEILVEVDEQILGPFPGVLAETYSRRAHRWLWSWSIFIENQPELIHTLELQRSGKPIYVRADDRRGRVLPASSKFTSGSEPYARLILQGTGALE
jgi:hypothetical protein